MATMDKRASANGDKSTEARFDSSAHRAPLCPQVLLLIERSLALAEGHALELRIELGRERMEADRWRTEAQRLRTRESRPSAELEGLPEAQPAATEDSEQVEAVRQPGPPLEAERSARAAAVAELEAERSARAAAERALDEQRTVAARLDEMLEQTRTLLEAERTARDVAAHQAVRLEEEIAVLREEHEQANAAGQATQADAVRMTAERVRLPAPAVPVRSSGLASPDCVMVTHDTLPTTIQPTPPAPDVGVESEGGQAALNSAMVTHDTLPTTIQPTPPAPDVGVESDGDLASPDGAMGAHDTPPTPLPSADNRGDLGRKKRGEMAIRLRAEGKSWEEIGAALGCHPSTARRLAAASR
jgi:hypothetical protein